MIRLHATCLDLDGAGLLLRGPSGSGKSDIAFRLMEEGALLVSDDQVEVRRDGEQLLARPPETIAGLLEVRGMGLFRFGWVPTVLALVVDLVPPDHIERMPDPVEADILGVHLPLMAINPWEISSCAKVRLAMRMARGSVMPVR